MSFNPNTHVASLQERHCKQELQVRNLRKHPGMCALKISEAKREKLRTKDKLVNSGGKTAKRKKYSI